MIAQSCTLTQLSRIIMPQPEVTMHVYDFASGKLLWVGPAHYFDANSDIGKKHIKELSIGDRYYKVKLGRN